MTAFMKAEGNNDYLETLLLTEKEINVLNKNIDTYPYVVIHSNMTFLSSVFVKLHDNLSSLFCLRQNENNKKDRQ